MDHCEAALRYAGEGYPVLPCRPGTKLPLTRRGFLDASADPVQIRAWWEKSPLANIAVVPGEGGAVVVDIDGETGRCSLETMDLPEPGRVTVSPGKGGGFHYWYRLPPDWTGTVGNSKPAPGIDIRGHNGYIMVPPSVHPDTGTRYTLARDEPLTVLPARFLLPQAQHGSAGRSLLDIRNVLRRVQPKPSAQARAVLGMYIEDIRERAEGDRHVPMLDHVWDLAVMVLSGQLTHEQVMEYGEAYQEACEPWDVKDDFRSALLGAYRQIPDPDGSKLYLQLASESVPRRARWLWHEMIPLGALTILAGREGIGKSTVAFDIIARASRGLLPGDMRGSPRGTVVVATEDSWEEKILPCLMLTGADLTRIGYLTSADRDWFTDVVLPDDLQDIERLCGCVDAGIILFDPLTSRMSPQIDTYKDSDVRRALEPLAGFARHTGTSVIGVMHVNKGSGDPVNSVMGSRAFTATARQVLFAAQVPDADSFGISVVKSNSGPSNQGTSLYTLEPGAVIDGIPGVRVRWGTMIADTMEEITRGTPAQRAVHRHTDDEVSVWVRAYLAGKGSVWTADIQEDMRSAGFSDRQVRTVSARLVQDGIIEKVRCDSGRWEWRLL